MIRCLKVYSTRTNPDKHQGMVYDISDWTRLGAPQRMVDLFENRTKTHIVRRASTTPTVKKLLEITVKCNVVDCIPGYYIPSIILVELVTLVIESNYKSTYTLLIEQGYGKWPMYRYFIMIYLLKL